MFIRFQTKERVDVALNVAQIISIELPQPLSGIQGGGRILRIHATEGRVYSLDPKLVDFEDLIEQIKDAVRILDLKELGNVGQDKGELT